MYDPKIIAQMEAIKEASKKRSYDYKGFRPYGAAQLYILDDYIDEYFDGNVVEKIINDGIGKFIINEDLSEAALHITGLGDVLFVKSRENE